MSGKRVASVKRLDINGSCKLHAMLFTFQGSLPIPHVLLLGKLCTGTKSGIPRRSSSSFKKSQRRPVCCSLVATRITTNYERQPRSANLCGHERCCVHEVNLRASSYRYKYHLLTIPTPPAYQELNFLSKTSASIQHGRGVVVPVSKRSEKMSCGHRESSHLLPKTVQYLGMSSSSKRPQTTSKPSVSRWSCSSTYATDEKNVSSLLLPTSLTARS
jgi:hypothetical protein